MQFAKDPLWTMQFEQYSRTKDQACIYTVHVHCKRTKLFCRFKSECSMPPRRNRIPNEVRRRIFRAFEYPTGDYLSVVDTLGVNRSTARSIVTTYLREGIVNERPRVGRNNVRVDDEMRDCINEILNENCLLTMQQINEEPAKPLVCDRTIGKTPGWNADKRKDGQRSTSCSQQTRRDRETL